MQPKNNHEYLTTEKILLFTPYVILFFWVTYNFYFLLETGYTRDDEWNSLVKGQIIEENISLFTRVYNEVKGWFLGAGSIRFLYYAFVYPFYYFIHSVWLVKAFVILVLSINTFLFYIFTKKITQSTFVSLAAGLFVTSLFQLRLWHDPIIGFPSYIAALVMCFILGSLIFFYNFIKENNKQDLKKSIFLFACACLFYELAVPFFLVFIALAFGESQNIKQSIYTSKPFILISFIYIALITFIKSIYIPIIKNTVSTYPILQLHLAPNDFITTFLIQLSAAFPLNYFNFNKESLELITNQSDLYIIIIFGFLISFLFYKTFTKKEPNNLLQWALAGSLFLILPSLLVALSGHQKEIMEYGYGLAYFPVFMEYFGAAILILTAIFFTIKQFNNNLLKLFFAIIIGISFVQISIINLGLNRAVAQVINQERHYPRTLIHAAIKEGILHNVKGELKRRDHTSFIFRIDNLPSDSYRMYATYTGKLITTCQMINKNQKEIDATNNSIDCVNILKKKINVNSMYDTDKTQTINISPTNSFALTYNYDHSSGKEGKVIIGKINTIKLNLVQNKIQEMMITDINIYDLKQNKITQYKNKIIDFMEIQKLHGIDITIAKELYKI